MTNGGHRLRVQVLGPLRVLDADDRDITPTGRLQRRLLALLVLRRGRIVSIDSAVDALWPAAPPADPVAALQNHLFRMRRALPDGLIESVGDGYRLEPGLVTVDADRLVGFGGEGATVALASEIDALLDRWQGPAYPELDDLDEGRAEAVRLEDLRVTARETRAQVHVQQGATDGVVADLVSLVDANPLRERPRALLMTALAATGRRVEALRVYDDFRRLLGDELGIDPSPALSAQHVELLNGPGLTPATPTSVLPSPVTSLLGRDTLAGEVTALVSAHRLVTLVGPGGVGKTRLLIEVGHRLRAEGAARPVVMCELAGADAASMVDAVAAALRIDARPATRLVDRIVDVLGENHVVLLVDNCEHVLEAGAELIVELLTRCANVRVAATSRERLRVAGEQVRVVPTLPFDHDDAPAVQLFLDRARAVTPAFEPDTHERTVIAEIVRRLDGLPLAIELAAARLHSLALDEVADGLDERFELLAPGYRTSNRHGSLMAVVSWSYGLLDAQLRDRFADLSVFVTSFDSAGAAAVCGVDQATISAALTQLVERSLVMRAPGRRYVLLETLRAFGVERLVDAGRLDDVSARHAHHHVEWLASADERMTTPGPAVLAEIDAAVPELRVALAWLLDHHDIERAGRLVRGLLNYGVLRLRPDVLAWSGLVIGRDPQDRSPLAPKVWVAAAYAAWMSGDIAGCATSSNRALRLAERADAPVPPEVLTIRGDSALFEGRLEEAADWYRRAVAAAEHDPAHRQMASATELLALAYAGDRSVGALATTRLAELGDAATPCAAYVWYCAGEAELNVDPARARDRFARALQLAELTNASFVTGVAGASKASIDARFDDPLAAADEYRQLIVHWRRAGMWSTQWTMLRSIVGLLLRLERHRDAAILEGAVRATASGHRIFGADEVELGEIGAQLRKALGDADYEAARREGAMLDGDTAVEHALRSL